MGNCRSARTLRNSCPTAPVAPTIATCTDIERLQKRPRQLRVGASASTYHGRLARAEPVRHQGSDSPTPRAIRTGGTPVMRIKETSHRTRPLRSRFARITHVGTAKIGLHFPAGVFLVVFVVM